MNQIYLPENYTPRLSPHQVQLAISFIKRHFQNALSDALNLERVSAPLFVDPRIGINDNLSGVERPVSFDVPAIGIDAEIIHSLAKWKRAALKQYGFSLHEGLVTDMNAIRRDEDLDNLHSIYVDQWDWEQIISEEDRNPDYLMFAVRAIVNAICNTNEKLKRFFPTLTLQIKRDVTFISARELERLYPDSTPEERENAFTKEHGTVFVTEIGEPLKNGQPHGKRAPDYDDWSLNGDLLVWNELLGRAEELSSMGIRVDPETLDAQLVKANCVSRREQPYHQMLLRGELPLTIGGGIGQSRLCMLLMQCAHIGEVQASLWDEQTVIACGKAGIPLL